MMIDQIKAKLTISEAIQKYTQAEVIRKGSSYWCKCLTNYEKTPSMQIFPDKNYYRCFSCGRYGDQIDLVAEALKLSLADTIKYLANDLGLSKDISQEERERIEQERQLKEKEKLKKQEELNMIEKEYRRLVDIEKLMYSFLLSIKTEEDLDRFEVVKSLQHKEILAYWLDILLNGTHEEKLEIVKVTKGWTPWKEDDADDAIESKPL